MNYKECHQQRYIGQLGGQEIHPGDSRRMVRKIARYEVVDHRRLFNSRQQTLTQPVLPSTEIMNSGERVNFNIGGPATTLNSSYPEDLQTPLYERLRLIARQQVQTESIASKPARQQKTRRSLFIETIDRLPLVRSKPVLTLLMLAGLASTACEPAPRTCEPHYTGKWQDSPGDNNPNLTWGCSLTMLMPYPDKPDLKVPEGDLVGVDTTIWGPPNGELAPGSEAISLYEEDGVPKVYLYLGSYSYVDPPRPAYKILRDATPEEVYSALDEMVWPETRDDTTIAMESAVQIATDEHILGSGFLLSGSVIGKENYVFVVMAEHVIRSARGNLAGLRFSQPVYNLSHPDNPIDWEIIPFAEIVGPVGIDEYVYAVDLAMIPESMREAIKNRAIRRVNDQWDRRGTVVAAGYAPGVNFAMTMDLLPYTAAGQADAQGSPITSEDNNSLLYWGILGGEQSVWPTEGWSGAPAIQNGATIGLVNGVTTEGKFTTVWPFSGLRMRLLTYISTIRGAP